MEFCCEIENLFCNFLYFLFCCFFAIILQFVFFPGNDDYWLTNKNKKNAVWCCCWKQIEKFFSGAKLQRWNGKKSGSSLTIVLLGANDFKENKYFFFFFFFSFTILK